MACASNCSFSNITFECVTPSYPVAATNQVICTAPQLGSVTTSCVSYPNPLYSPFAYSYANHGGLFTNLAILLKATVTGNIPIVYIGTQVGNAVQKTQQTGNLSLNPNLANLSNQGGIILNNAMGPSPSAQSLLLALIYWNHSGQIEHLLPPTFNTGGTYWIWGLCNDWTLTDEDWDDSYLLAEGCEGSVLSSTIQGEEQPIFCFFDRTSMTSAIINKTYQNIQYFLSQYGFANDIYYLEAGGERYLQWPLSLLDTSIHNYLAPGCGWSTGGCGNGYNYVHNGCTGSDGIERYLTSTIPPGPHEDAICLIFCDESWGGIYYGFHNDQAHSCNSHTGNQNQLWFNWATLSNTNIVGIDNELGQHTGHSAAVWKYAAFQGLSDASGGYLEEDYKDFVTGYIDDGSGNPSLEGNNIRTFIFIEGYEPNPNQFEYGAVVSNQKKGGAQHFTRMFGGANIGSNMNAMFPDLAVPFPPTWTTMDMMSHGTPGEQPLGSPGVYNHQTGIHVGNIIDRYVSVDPAIALLHGGANPLYHESAFCKLDYWAEQITGIPGQDWALGNFGVTGYFMGVGSAVYSIPYLPADATLHNPMTTVTHDLNGTSLQTGYWPSKLFFELYRMAYVTDTPIYTTGPDCTVAPCDGKCHLRIRVYRDVDGDCVRDTNEPWAANVQVPIEDPSGNITIHSTGNAGLISLDFIDVGTYIINGKSVNMNWSCKTYTAEIPLFEESFSDPTINCVLGCTDPLATNYNPLATIDDGSCIIPGCMNECSANYDSNANTDDGSCCPCIELKYVIEDSVRAYAHAIQLTIEWPYNSSNMGNMSTWSPPGGTAAVGLSTSAYGSPSIIYQETFFYDPNTGVTDGNGSVIGMHEFTKILDQGGNHTGTLLLDPLSCGMSSYCWVFRWDITADASVTALAFDDHVYTNIQMGKFQLSAFDQDSVYIYIPFEDGWTYMGNAIGGLPWPSHNDLLDAAAYQNYMQNTIAQYAAQGQQVPWHLSGHIGMMPNPNSGTVPSFFWGALGWATNYFQVWMSKGVDWLANNGGLMVTWDPLTGVTMHSPHNPPLGGHSPAHMGVNNQGFNDNYSNVCGDPPDGCTDPLAINYNPAAGTQHGNMSWDMQQHMGEIWGHLGACIYECVEIVVELYFVAVRVYGDVRSTRTLDAAGGAWTYEAVFRNDNFPISPTLGYYNGIPLGKLTTSNFANDVEFQLLDELGNVVYDSGIIAHPRSSTGGWRLRWGCYDDNGAFLDSGAPGDIVDGASLNWSGPGSGSLTSWQSQMTGSGWSPYDPVTGLGGTGQTTTTGLGIGIGGDDLGNDDNTNHLFASYTCEALVPCAEDTCYKFKRVGSWTKGWESIGVNIYILKKGAGGNIGSGSITYSNTPVTYQTIANYHIPPGWYKLNMSKWGGMGAPNTTWASNWENEREVVFATNPVTANGTLLSPGNALAWGGQYWSLWGCLTPGGTIPPGGGTPTTPGHTVQLRQGCTDPLSDKYDMFALESDGSCTSSKTYTEFTTLRVVINIGGCDMLGRSLNETKFDSTNSNIGERPYDTGTREMTSDQRDAKKDLPRISRSMNFFEFVFKREPFTDEPTLEDGVQTNMEFARVLQQNVMPGAKYTYEVDVPYGENVTFDIIDNFARDLTYKIEQTGLRKRSINGPKKL
jgi:hypothetical protein